MFLSYGLNLNCFIYQGKLEKNFMKSTRTTRNNEIYF